MSIIPGWDSIAGAHWWSNFYFWASIVALILLGVTEVVSHRYSERKDELSAIAQNAAEKAHDEEMARLHVQASNADERSKALEVEAARLRLALEDAQSETRRIAAGVARHVTAPQRQLLASYLMKSGLKVRMISEQAPEPRQFRDELASALRDAGVEILDSVENTALGSSGIDIYGTSDASGATLATALAASGIKDVSLRPNVGSALAIRVGLNPVVP